MTSTRLYSLVTHVERQPFRSGRLSLVLVVHGLFVLGLPLVLLLQAIFDTSKQVGTPRLTWDGHEFLDSIRDDSVWSAVKKRLAPIGGSVSIGVLRAVAVEVVKSRLGLSD
jgi:hypothetical protein